MRSAVLFICSASCGLYSAGSGVRRVHVVLPELRMRKLFVSMYVLHVDIIECLRSRKSPPPMMQGWSGLTTSTTMRLLFVWVR